MLPVKRYRWTPRQLIARWECPECGDKTGFPVQVSPFSDRDRHAVMSGKPTEVTCLCGGTMDYIGLSVPAKPAEPHEPGPQWRNDELETALKEAE